MCKDAGRGKKEENFNVKKSSGSTSKGIKSSDKERAQMHQKSDFNDRGEKGEGEKRREECEATEKGISTMNGVKSGEKGGRKREARRFKD